ncbi:MAG: helix-turn-helix domain-containing protein [Defluviitaleaceae bacterium]|nr:helix-turn-helix domain-containing protein [Defluviitaleaceae bacterium]
MIGKNIREIRKIRGLSPLELAKKILLSERHMSAIESGDRNATAITLLKICDILEISVNELFYETEEKK